MKDNPAVDFSSDIIKAALTNFAYDGQSEGSRALYVSELIALSMQQGKIRKAILEGLSSERQDTWALVQLFDLATIFAKQGDKEARQAIYDNFYSNPIQYSEWVGETAIIEIDGIEGLKYIADVKGKIIANDAKEWEDSFKVDLFQEKNPKINVYEELTQASETNENIKTYLETIRTHKAENSYWKRPKLNYQIVTERINSKAIVALPPARAKELSRTDIKKLANDFLEETNPLKLEKYMRVFDRVKYPYNYQPLLKLAKSKNKKDSRLIEYASSALKYFSGPDIRQFAIECLSKTKTPSDYLNLLVSNYKIGDCKLLKTIANNCRTEHDIHGIVYGYINIYKANKTKECREPLEIVYEKLTCSIHRMDIVKILIDNKVISQPITDELKHDSNMAIRQLL